MLSVQHSTPYRFAKKVGLAPSTTVMTMGAGTRVRAYNPYTSEVDMRGMQGMGVASESVAWRTGRPYDFPGTTALVINQGHASVVSGAPGLGVVNEKDQWQTGRWNRLRTHGTVTMRYWHNRRGKYREQLINGAGGLGLTNGEAIRNLSGLGAVPNDDDLARIYGYTPVHYGWIYGNTPTGKKYYADGLYGAPGTIAALAADNPEALDEILRMQRRQILYQGITTLAIASMAGLTIYGVIRKAMKSSRVKKRRARR